MRKQAWYCGQNWKQNLAECRNDQSKIIWARSKLIITTLPAAPRVDKAEKKPCVCCWLIWVCHWQTLVSGKPLSKRRGTEPVMPFSQDFWVLSPRSLDDLLIEPNIPVVNLEITASNGVQVWLNDKQIINNAQGGKATANTLRLHQGWNHVVIRPAGQWRKRDLFQEG